MKKRKTYEVSVINKTYSKTYSDQTKFYTSDTALELNFQLKEVEYDFDSAEIILLNINDRSLATRPVGKSAEGFTYELEDDILAHYGQWKCQLKFNEGGEIYVSSPVVFRIENDLTNDRPPKFSDVVSWTNLRDSANMLIADLQQAIEDEAEIKLAEEARVNAEIERQVTFEKFKTFEDGNFLKTNSITAEKINPISGEVSVNVLDPDNILQGQFHNSVGDKAVLTTNANWSTTKTPIKVSAGDVVSFNKAYSNNHYFGVDDSGTILQSGKASTDGITQITVSVGVTSFYSNIQNVYLDGAMITINNPMPTEFVPYGVTGGQSKKLEWLTVSETNLDSNLKDKINSENAIADIASDWKDKSMISAGDSITWQDARVYSGTTNVARGWQTHVKENLELASVKNIALSGKPMADGTTAGGGTVTTVLTETAFLEDLLVIAAGTNDFKLNVPIGELKNVGDVFDRNTFYGAYQTTLEYILSKRKDIRIVLFTPLHRNQSNYNSTIFANTAGHKLIDYVEAIKALGARYSVPVCDMYANSGINMLTLGVDTRDGLHPNDVGYEKMGRYAAKFIDNL